MSDSNNDRKHWTFIRNIPGIGGPGLSEEQFVNAKRDAIFSLTEEIRRDDFSDCRLVVLQGRESKCVASRFKDPNEALELYVRSFQAGVYPPSSILYWLCGAFEKYLSGGGDVTLEEALKFPPGQTNTLKKWKVEDRKIKAVWDKALLEALFQLKKGVNALIAAAYTEDENRPYAPDTVSKWAVEYKKDFEQNKTYFQKLSPADKKIFMEAAVNRLRPFDTKNILPSQNLIDRHAWP